VVDGDDRDRIDAARQDGVAILQIAGKMVVAACRRERARNGEQHHLPARKDVGGADLLRAVGGHRLEGCFWQLVANRNGHGFLARKKCVPVRYRIGPRPAMAAAYGKGSSPSTAPVWPVSV